MHAYHAASHDDALLAKLFPTLEDIIECHVRGTRYGIRMDPSDGLIRAGEPGVQLTWMDARVGDWVVTPRTGKPIEVNALWCSALRFMADAAKALGRPADRYEAMAGQAATGFQRFWNPARGFCFDVLDGPDGNDPALRPNQIFAASLPTRVLPDEQLRAVVRACERALLTPAGLQEPCRQRTGISAKLWRRPGDARRGLSSGHGLGLADRAVHRSASERRSVIPTTSSGFCIRCGTICGSKASAP